MFSRKVPLVIAGILCAIGALLHLVTIIGGPDFYRFMGRAREWPKWLKMAWLIPRLLL